MNIEDYVDLVEDFDSLSQKEQVKLIAFFLTITNSQDEFTTSEITSAFINNNLSAPGNVSHQLALLSKAKPPTLVKKGSGFTFHRTAKKILDEQFVGSKHKLHISKTLRDLVPKIKSSEQKVFLEEAIKCFEIQAYRASILMSWLLTMDVIYEYILRHKLSEFNTAIQAHGKYKKIIFSKKDDFSEMKESDFIEVLRTAKIVSNDIRKILDEKLNFRNTIAHPNTITIKESKAISVIDDLVENVIFKYQ